MLDNPGGAFAAPNRLAAGVRPGDCLRRSVTWGTIGTPYRTQRGA